MLRTDISRRLMLTLELQRCMDNGTGSVAAHSNRFSGWVTRSSFWQQ